MWNDLDKDGIQDTNEPGIAAVTVRLISFKRYYYFSYHNY
ncbi:MAG: hypothetical protein IPP48_14945 [Chitinophagaceae bacterium]|nr:hypothetical protein [Chitinophagaceae bacterium]